MNRTSLLAVCLFALAALSAGYLSAQYTPPSYTYSGTSFGDFLVSATIGTWTHPIGARPVSYQYNTTSSPGVLQGGVQYTMSVTNNPTEPQAVSLFIDYQVAGNFTTAMAVGSVWLQGAQTSQINFTIPMTAASGVTRMRLMHSYDFSGTTLLPLNPTGSFTYGQCDDFNVTISTGPAVTGSATAGTAKTVFANEQGPGGNGIHAGTFTLGANNQGPMTVTNLALAASGTGDDSLAYSEVVICRDGNANGTFEAASDYPATNASIFATDNGTINFTVNTPEQGFPASETRTYFVVVKLAGTASPGDTFNSQVTDVTASGGSKTGFPTAVMNGLIIDTPAFVFADASSATASTVYLGTSGNVCQQFSLSYPAGPDDKPTSITVTGLGSADEAADLAAVELWHDSDSSGSFNAAVDTMVDSTSFSADNGTATFSMATHADFQSGQTRTFFVVYNLNTTAGDMETFKCYVSAAAVSGLNPNLSGLPTPGTGGTAGLTVSANVLIATLNGPGVPAVVNSNTTGASGDGVLLCDVTLAAAPGGAWGVTSLTFNASGTGNHANAYSELGVYIDDGNGAWDGAATDVLAAPKVTGGFTANAATFALTATNIPAGSSTRYFLTGKMNGSALSGQTFNANLESIVANPPAGGVPAGLPTAPSAAVVIDVASLTVLNGPSAPVAAVHVSGMAAAYLVGRFRLHALNNTVTMTGMTLNAGGTGDWTTDVAATGGVEVYLDDGDGVYNAADTLIYSGAGAATVTATFTSPVMLAGATTGDLWIRIGLTNTAGSGVAATPETFTLAVAGPGSVSASTNVVLGSPAPATTSLGAIEFNVSTFVPQADVPKGGKAISLTGSGFMTPFSVTIGGVVCPGTPSIAGGTQVSGLLVPPGSGKNLAIVVTSGALPPQTLTQTFTYKLVSDTGGSGGSGSGCSTGSGPWLPSVIALGVVAGACLLVLRRKA